MNFPLSSAVLSGLQQATHHAYAPLAGIPILTAETPLYARANSRFHIPRKFHPNYVGDICGSLDVNGGHAFCWPGKRRQYLWLSSCMHTPQLWNASKQQALTRESL